MEADNETTLNQMEQQLENRRLNFIARIEQLEAELTASRQTVEDLEDALAAEKAKVPPPVVPDDAAERALAEKLKQTEAVVEKLTAELKDLTRQLAEGAILMP
jgi:DNA repair exonuclease SbcCD ATPase subunit